jgi:hypothetical protein
MGMMPDEILSILSARRRELDGTTDCKGSGCASVAAARRELSVVGPRRRGRKNTLWYRRRVNHRDFQEEPSAR